MNEYQDQIMWWRVERRVSSRWQFVGDYDSREGASDAAQGLPEGTYIRVRRMTGLPDGR